MGLRFRKSISLCKGVKLNLGMKSASISVGRKGIHQSFSTTGRTTTSLSIPGTGVGYTKSINMKKGFKKLFGKKEDEKKEEKKAKGAKAETAAKTSEKKGPTEEEKAEYEEYIRQITLMRGIHKQADEPVDWEAELEDKKTHDTAVKVLAGDIDTWLAVIDECRPYDDILEYGSDFEVGTDDPEFLEVEFHVRSADVVPDRELILDEKGLKDKALSKTAYNDMLQDYVCSCILRVARDTFALLPVKRVVIHATDTVLNTATGNENEETLVSVAIERQQLEGLNFERLDPSDALSAFPLNMNFKKTGGFSPVDRLNV
ncbi:MAG: DUF4236 domain-containing protein [Lachnospiraceae bacterium]|nr:DUF4236 domain-containing protein [Lachnospiraceae bacterium]